jgi:hypothetical protein
MRALRQALWFGLVVVALVGLSVAPAHAQAKMKHKHKHYVVTSDRAVIVTRTVLIRRGYRVIRVDRVGPNRVVYYRHGRGPLRRMVIRAVRDQVVFEEAEPTVLVDIDIDLNR